MAKKQWEPLGLKSCSANKGIDSAIAKVEEVYQSLMNDPFVKEKALSNYSGDQIEFNVLIKHLFEAGHKLEELCKVYTHHIRSYG